MQRVAIYLAGNIKKGHESVCDGYWGDDECQKIIAILKPSQVDFLHPAIRTDDLSDQVSVFGRDMTQVKCSDVVFVDARHRRGLGVGAEMMWAKMNGIPVVTLCPSESHYRKNQVKILDIPVRNWIHPFVEGLSDVIADTVEDGAEWIRRVLVEEGKELPIKGIKFIDDAMSYYKSTQFLNDVPMQKITECNLSVRSKMSEEY